MGRRRQDDTAPLLDAVLVVAFAALGRRSHDEGLSLTGVVHTAWPFVVGLLVGWGVAGSAGRDGRSVRGGLVIWPVTVIVGLLVRRLLGDGTAGPFVLVATGVLGALLVGWRLVAAAVARRAR